MSRYTHPLARFGFRIRARGAHDLAGRDSPRFCKRFPNGIQGSVDAVRTNLAGRKNSVAPRSTPAERGTSCRDEQPRHPSHTLSFLRHGQIYQSDVLMLQDGGEAFWPRPSSIVSMSLQSAIPWGGALQHCPPPLHQPASFSYS